MPKKEKMDEAYRKKRSRNNEAVKKSRTRSQLKAKETKKKIEELTEINAALEGEISGLKSRCDTLKRLILMKDPNSQIAKMDLEEILKIEDEEST
uniref:Putative ovary c/ebpg transcription factor n=1 Tax=Tabanus bromius TaxID=304241 RepID=A0A0K8TPZ0_TABBR